MGHIVCVDYGTKYEGPTDQVNVDVILSVFFYPLKGGPGEIWNGLPQKSLPLDLLPGWFLSVLDLDVL